MERREKSGIVRRFGSDCSRKTATSECGSQEEKDCN